MSPCAWAHRGEGNQASSNCAANGIRRDLAQDLKYDILSRVSNPKGCVALAIRAQAVAGLMRLVDLPEDGCRGLDRKDVPCILGQARRCGIPTIRIALIAARKEMIDGYRSPGFDPGPIKRCATYSLHVRFMNDARPANDG